MPRRKSTFHSGCYYHLYNRGHNRQKIFFERENYLYFLRLMRKYLLPDAADLTAYCLMPNHYHLLAYLRRDELHRSIGPMILAYTRAINNRYDRSGSLFQGRFKGVWVDDDAYLLHLTRYIHNNPVEAGLVTKPDDWEFSSYRDYIGQRKGTLISAEVVLGQFASRQAYQEFVEGEQDQSRISHLLLD